MTSSPVPSTVTQPQTQTPSRKPSTNTHRLLYRGSLSLPDSHIPLDGLSFTTNIASQSRNSPSTSLLENPLALALESMRGRPLHFKGTEQVTNMWLDSTLDIHVYVHHHSLITQIYFENMFCLTPITSTDKHTTTGIRVGLSDTGTEDDFIIYGQLRPQPPPSDDTTPVPSTSTRTPETLHILAARILQHPPPRLPRPDDPTPRKPSSYLPSAAGKRKRDVSSAQLDFGGRGEEKRAKGLGNGKGKARATGGEENEQVRMAREVMLRGPSSSSLPRLLGRDARPGRRDDSGFKVPALPLGRTGSFEGADVFGGGEIISGSSGKEKQKGLGSVSEATEKEKEKERPGSDELEKANKTVIKQAALTTLAKHGFQKGHHPEFSEVYAATYRGAAFALRNVIRIQAVNMRVVEKLLETHAKIYVLGNGESHVGEK
ncbi:hypothetical protein EIP91_004039 [Steccherinum ochraceum]|uniref:Sld7 C-terminal domain-containing protein n=1 Tax=Steccherinum ochraceum TaxID=92696 RepID=A0A4R0RL15_9APHY|nr:hypothetical protein EIP91_004039 [Steccherinum ochraceum]